MLAIRRLILTRLIGDLVAAKGKITVDSEHGYDPEAKSFARGEVNVGAAVQDALQFDEVHLMVGGSHAEGYESWVHVIFGNGNSDLDMISDYTRDLEPILKPINDWIEGIEKGDVRLTTA
jgi:hypothetical protein